MLAACSEPSSEGAGEGYFTISLSANENTRAIFPPTNSNDLRFSVKFKNTASGAEKAFTSDRSGSIKGKIGVGNYIVTMDINLISDGSLYARGVAYDNPVEIGPGQNPIKVYAFDVNNASPPVISAKPQGTAYTSGVAAKPLTVTASVNDNGGLSYQWYSNTTNSTSNGTAIGNATLPNYTPSTGTSGTTWYYVIVKNTSAGKPTTINTVPVSIVNSGTGGGLGSADNPFLVNDITTLQKVGSGTDGWTLDAHYRQTADIDLASVANWTPVSGFLGSYDGNGKIISNLTINATTEDNQGLFGRIFGSAVVKNVGLKNCKIVGNQRVGGVVGLNGSTVQNCYAIGNVSGDRSVGGVVGYNQGMVQNCYATGSVSGETGVGGVVGDNSGGTVQSCYATSNVSGNSNIISATGGVAGWNCYDGMIQYCYATGNVSGYNIVGGVVGANDTESTVQYCYATGNVSSDGVVGGVVGHNSSTVQNCYVTGNISSTSSLVGGVGGANEGFIQNCYATGNVSGAACTGGVAGYLKNSSSTSSVSQLQNCIALNPNVSNTDGPDFGRVLGFFYTFDGGTPILTNNYGRADMKINGGSPTWTNMGLNDLDGASITSSNWGSQNWWATAGFDFTNVWEWRSNGLPILRNMPGTATQNPVVSGTGGSGGTGTAADPFLVSTVATLQKVGSGIDGWSLSAHYKQTADIDLASVSNWTPIGTDTAPFTGSYDGNGKTISNLTINVPTKDEQGLFGWIGVTAIVKNVGLVNCSIVGTSALVVGGVVRYNYGTVQNCYVSGNVSGYQEVGGVVGANYGTVQYCYTTGTIYGIVIVGGVVGENGGTVQYCYSTGNISQNYSGGVAGSNSGIVQYCYATGTISGNYAGGVVGSNSGTVQYCYATGNISGNSSHTTGGVVGSLTNDNPSSIEATVKNCVALNPDVSGSGTYIGRVLGSLSTSDGTPTLANNYGRSDMQKNGGSTTWTNIGLTDQDGASVTSSNWGTESWWTTDSNWAQKGWPIGTVWEWRSNSLPILKGMPGSATQNPVVK
jgi:hypothetical protein